MVGPALHNNVARLEVDLGIVEKQVNLPRNNRGVIDRPRAVHARLARIFRRRAFRGKTQLPVELKPGLGIGLNPLLRLKLDHSKDGTVSGRHNSNFLIPRVALLGQSGGSGIGYPQKAVGDTHLRLSMNAWSLSVHGEDSLSVFVFPGDNTPNHRAHRYSPKDSFPAARRPAETTN
jgi:hypothetical protein